MDKADMMFIGTQVQIAGIRKKADDMAKWQDYLASGLTPLEIVNREVKALSDEHDWKLKSNASARRWSLRIFIASAVILFSAWLKNPEGVLFLSLTVVSCIVILPALGSFIWCCLSRPSIRKSYCWIMAEKMIEAKNKAPEGAHA
jgi:hypothetical protein